MQPLRFVIVGAGANVLHMHRPAFDLSQVEVVGTFDRNEERGAAVAESLGVMAYDNLATMLAEAAGDVAVVLTNHPSHPQLVMQCLRAGYHVLVEKPMAVQVREADAMIAEAERHNRQLGVCFQRRYMPSVLAAAKLIAEGTLGDIQYAQQSVLWTRPRLYFTERTWRGTWAGEGGGVIINQAAHNLDVLCYLLGLPTTVKAWTAAQLHHIETEDTAHAMLRWDNGAMGFFHVSTAEAGPANYLEIRGTKGYLTFTDYELTHYALDGDIRDYMDSSTDPYAQPTGADTPLALNAPPGDHIALYRNFCAAVLEHRPSLVDGASGRMSLELANAVIYSAETGGEVSLPLDRDAYSNLLKRKIEVASDA